MASLKRKAAEKPQSVKPKKLPRPDSESSSSEEEEEEEEVVLHGFSEDEDDSSDDEPTAFDVEKLPTVAKDDAAVKRKLEKAKLQPTEERGVLYLGRIPHGFYEDQLKGYFSQFGTITRLRLSRNKRSGKSKHYGFLEFESSAVAQIVAETMDNYLLMGHILRCKIVPKNEVHPELWVGSNRKWRRVPRARVARTEHEKLRTSEEQERANRRLLKRQSQRQKKIQAAGITYDLRPVGYKAAA